LSNSFNKSAWNDAIKLFERALTLDPQNMTALTALAVALDTRADNHWSEDPAGDIARADELISAAMALQPEDTWVHWAKARLFASKQQWRSALTEDEMSITDDRNNSRAYGDAGYYKMQLGRSQDGLADVETALRLDPHSNQAAEWQTRLCHLRAHLAQWEQAIEQCEKAVAAAPWDNPSLGALAAAYAWAGHDKEAKQSAVKLGERDPNFIQSLRKYMDASDDPTFKAECARIIEGLRKAGVPEGTARTN
jgi:adenylate cyclase